MIAKQGEVAEHTSQAGAGPSTPPVGGGGGYLCCKGGYGRRLVRFF